MKNTYRIRYECDNCSCDTYMEFKKGEKAPELIINSEKECYNCGNYKYKKHPIVTIMSPYSLENFTYDEDNY